MEAPFFSPTFKRFLGYTRPYTLISAGSVASGVVKFSLALLLLASLALVTHYVLDANLSADEKVVKLMGVLGLLILGLGLRIPITYLRSYLAELAGNRTIFDIRQDLYRHIQRLSLAYHHARRTGTTVSRLTSDINAAQGILDRGILAALVDSIFLIGVVIFLFWQDWRLASVSLATLPLYAFIFAYINPRVRQVTSEVQDELQEMSGEVTEKLNGLAIVMAFAREKTEQLNFFQRHRRYLDKVMRRVRLNVTRMSYAEFITAIGPIVVVGYGGYRVITGAMELEWLIVFYGFISHLYLPTRRLADTSAFLQENLGALDRVFEVLDSEPDIVDRPNAKPLPSVEGEIEFRDVHFSYRPGKPVLRGVSLAIEPGRAVALVGPSGAGKTTMANLVPRFYDIDEGAILIDGHDIRDVTLHSLRENIGIVPQDSILFSGSVRENIMYGRKGASDAEMIEAAHMAHAHEFIERLPDGYDTLIGERGVTLSGGQKQRVSIARAFLRDPRILILDEATSNLDSQTENIIQDALHHLMQGRTTLVIAHRLSTIVDCDWVVVLDQGRIVQEGTHDELAPQPGLYRKLCEEQFGYVNLEALNESIGN